MRLLADLFVCWYKFEKEREKKLNLWSFCMVAWLFFNEWPRNKIFTFISDTHSLLFFISFLPFVKLFLALALSLFLSLAVCEYVRYILFGSRLFVMSMLLLMLMFVSPRSSSLLWFSLRKNNGDDDDDDIYTLDLHVELTSIYMIQPRDQFDFFFKTQSKVKTIETTPKISLA